MLNDVMHIDMSFNCPECGHIGLHDHLVSIYEGGDKRFCPSCHTTILNRPAIPASKIETVWNKMNEFEQTLDVVKITPQDVSMFLIEMMDILRPGVKGTSELKYASSPS